MRESSKRITLIKDARILGRLRVLDDIELLEKHLSMTSRCLQVDSIF